MSLNVSHVDILNKVAQSLVATKKYASADEVFLDLALVAVRRKTAQYKRRIRRLERKYGTDFEDFSKRASRKCVLRYFGQSSQHNV